MLFLAFFCIVQISDRADENNKRSSFAWNTTVNCILKLEWNQTNVSCVIIRINFTRKIENEKEKIKIKMNEFNVKFNESMRNSAKPYNIEVHIKPAQILAFHISHVIVTSKMNCLFIKWTKFNINSLLIFEFSYYEGKGIVRKMLMISWFQNKKQTL